MAPRTSTAAAPDVFESVPLPPRIRGLYEVIGASALLALAREYGGRRLYVPKRVDGGHDIARALGVDAARRLAAHYGGETIDVPLLAGFETALRHAAIRAAWSTSSAREIAERFGTTERHVYRIVGGAAACDAQLDLFDPPPDTGQR